MEHWAGQRRVRRVEARAEDTEERRASKGQAGGNVNGNQRSEQHRQKGRGRTRQRVGRAGTNLAHGLWTSRSLDEGKCWVIRSQQTGRRAAYRAGKRAIRAGVAWVSLSGGQGQGRVRGILREGRTNKRAQMAE